MRCILGLLLGVVLATTAAAAETLEALIGRHGFAPAQVGVLVEDVASGRRLAEHRAHEPGMPASTLKLVTAVGVLERLGAGHRFTTRVALTGSLDAGGRLAGDVVLEGGGDPLLDIDGLMQLAWALRAAGVRTVAGRFVLDDARLPALPVINPDQPVEAGYNAGIGALSLAFNRVQRPAGGAFTVPRLAERGPAWRRLPFDQPAIVPVQDAGLHAALVFQELAAALGVLLPAPARAAAPVGGREIGRVESRPLRDIVQAMLLYSNNQIAEIVGLAATGAASLERSAEALAAQVTGLLPAVDWTGFAVTNHSGLDPRGRATPAQLMAVLELAEARHAILPLLPAAAWSGSLERRLRGPDTALRVWAKTGSLDFASALLGYALPASGRPLRLVVLVHDFAARAGRDKVEVPPPAMRRAADDFERRARDLRDAVASWALDLGAR